MMMPDVDRCEDVLRDLYGAEPTNVEVDSVLARCSDFGTVAHHRGVSLHGQRRKRRIAALSLGAVFLVVAAAGAATALWPEATPVTPSVSSFNAPEGAPVTPEEYERIKTYNLVPNTSRIGKLRPDEVKPLIELAPREQSRVIVDDPEIGRLIAVPAVDGSAVCHLYMTPGPLRDQQAVGGCGLEAFPPSGVEATVRESGDAQEVMGFAADDVESVRIVLADGTTEPAIMKENAFYWKSSGVKAVNIRSTRTGFSETNVDDLQS